MEVELKCNCGMKYIARESDIKRGWAKTCSKSCAAIKREYGRPNATYLNGNKVDFGKKYKRLNKPKKSYTQMKSLARLNRAACENGEIEYEEFIRITDDRFLSEDEIRDKIDQYYYETTHPFSSEALGQW